MNTTTKTNETAKRVALAKWATDHADEIRAYLMATGLYEKLRGETFVQSAEDKAKADAVLAAMLAPAGEAA